MCVFVRVRVQFISTCSRVNNNTGSFELVCSSSLGLMYVECIMRFPVNRFRKLTGRLRDSGNSWSLKWWNCYSESIWVSCQIANPPRFTKKVVQDAQKVAYTQANVNWTLSLSRNNQIGISKNPKSEVLKIAISRKSCAELQIRTHRCVLTPI